MELFIAHHIEGNTITLDQDESRHAIKVLRLRQGDAIHLTDGKGNLFEAIVILPDARELHAEIRSVKSFPQRNYWIHVAIAPTKNTDRLEWFLEKATEFGIDEISPMICKHSERTIIKPERLVKILVAAMKQSNQFHLPQLNETRSFKQVVADADEDIKLIAHCYNEQKNPITQVTLQKKNVLVLIGPEGDFSMDEVKDALGSGFTPISLGSTRLRTETAGLAAVQAIHFINEVAGKD